MTSKQTELDRLIGLAADKAEADGVQIDGEFGGPVHRWVDANVAHRPGTSFWIVFLLTAELADREARREGFRDQIDRAICLSKRHQKVSP